MFPKEKGLYILLITREAYLQCFFCTSKMAEPKEFGIHFCENTPLSPITIERRGLKISRPKRHLLQCLKKDVEMARFGVSGTTLLLQIGACIICIWHFCCISICLHFLHGRDAKFNGQIECINAHDNKWVNFLELHWFASSIKKCCSLRIFAQLNHVETQSEK